MCSVFLLLEALNLDRRNRKWLLAVKNKNQKTDTSVKQETKRKLSCPTRTIQSERQKEKDILFLGKDSANEKPWVFADCGSLSFLFPSIKASPFLAGWALEQGSLWVQVPNCNSVLILNKYIFTGERFGHLFVLGPCSQLSINDSQTWLALESTTELWQNTCDSSRASVQVYQAWVRFYASGFKNKLHR